MKFDADKVRKMYEEQGYTGATFAEKCGWYHSQLFRILKQGHCRSTTLDVIAQALGVPITEILEDETQKIKIMLDPGAIMPTRAHSTDAGLDLYSPVRRIIRANDWESIETGVHVAIPEGYVGMITSKSGLMANEGITSRGTIDCGYIGSIKAVLFNHSGKTYIVEPGQKITQLVLMPIITPELELVDSLEDTDRGNGGLGSTGKF